MNNVEFKSLRKNLHSDMIVFNTRQDQTSLGLSCLSPSKLSFKRQSKKWKFRVDFEHNLRNSVKLHFI